MTDVQTQVTDMNAGWYNYLTNLMNLDPTTFMLAQGGLGLQTSDSSGLFLMSDAQPPSASVTYYDPAGLSKRSSAYGSMLQAILPESGSSLQDILGNQYTNWITFRDTFFKDNPTTAKTQEEVFEQFANSRLNPREASTAITNYKKAQHVPLNAAIDALYAKDSKQVFTDAAGKDYSLYKYSATPSGAKTAINTGPSATIDFNSTTATTSLSHKTVNGAASGFYDIFSGGASANFDQLNTTAASSAFSIKGTIGKYATLATDPIDWFSSTELSRAYNAKDNNNVWDPNATDDWETYFNQDTGSLARRISQLFLVSDYDITVTSHATYDQSDYKKITTEASFGVWPFFSGSASATQTTSYTLNKDKSLSVNYKLNKGLIQIWGVSVANAPS